MDCVIGKKRPSGDRKSTRLNSSHLVISYAVFCLKKKKIVERLPVLPLRDEVRIRDKDPRRVAVRLEDRHRLPALHDEGLIVAEGLERLDDPVECVPVPRGLAGAPVDDEIVRLLRVLKVVLEHPEDGLLPPALAPQRRPARGFNALHPDSVIPSLRT